MQLAKWKKDEREFEVKLTNDHKGSIICRVPKPIREILGKSDSIKFVILGKKIVVTTGKKK